jgi:hypothetical protein
VSRRRVQTSRSVAGAVASLGSAASVAAKLARLTFSRARIARTLVEQVADGLFPGRHVSVNARSLVIPVDLSLAVDRIVVVFLVIVDARRSQRGIIGKGLVGFRFGQRNFGDRFSPRSSIARATSATRTATRSPGFFGLGFAARIFDRFLIGLELRLVINFGRFAGRRLDVVAALDGRASDRWSVIRPIFS